MTTNNDCKGCTNINRCEYEYTERSNKCPCKQCLIKVVCMTVCDEYLLFTGHATTIHNLLNEEIGVKPIVCRHTKETIYGRRWKG